MVRLFLSVLVFLFSISLTSCAAYERAERRAFLKYGVCDTICDYKVGFSTSNELSPTECSCYSPNTRGNDLYPWNGMKIIKCTPDCRTIAMDIIKSKLKHDID